MVEKELVNSLRYYAKLLTEQFHDNYPKIEYSEAEFVQDTGTILN